ncbi:NfeD family protein [Myceligenerans xiligouense]|uniref:Membrane protein implicated in regulation of membrane protease activity n=1 Tax=Myceligenerans xiligouense TaxID=253184 RepID=A0A3N4YJI7_9MICO|nr:NfeD family protein [Myceligenerans xiligouense]RPF19576.1 membrane protein implicated in regulation of membrane protease activity [Myceligenerans xiligouense]
MLVFIVLGILGLVISLLSVALGDLFELGDGALSGTSLGAGLLLFGATGAVVTSAGLPVVATYPIAAVVGLGVILLVNLLLKRLRQSDDATPRSLVGLRGAVTSEVSSAHGEVSLDNELETRMAFADAPIPQGARVTVVEQHGSRVKVTSSE